MAWNGGILKVYHSGRIFYPHFSPDMKLTSSLYLRPERNIEYLCVCAENRRIATARFDGGTTSRSQRTKKYCTGVEGRRCELREDYLREDIPVGMYMDIPVGMYIDIPVGMYIYRSTPSEEAKQNAGLQTLY